MTTMDRYDCGCAITIRTPDEKRGESPAVRACRRHEYDADNLSAPEFKAYLDRTQRRVTEPGG